MTNRDSPTAGTAPPPTDSNRNARAPTVTREDVIGHELQTAVFKHKFLRIILIVSTLLAFLFYFFLVCVVWLTVARTPIINPGLVIPSIAAFSVVPTTLLIAIFRSISHGDAKPDESIPLKAVDYLRDNQP